MGLITRLRESLVAGRPKNAVLSDNMTMDELAEALGGKRVAGSREALSSATYYACMRIRCDALAKLPVKVLQETGPGGTRKRRDHPLWELLSLRPNEYMTAYDLFWATEFQRLDYGRAFWVLDVKGGERKNIYLLDSSRVEIWVDEAGGTLPPKVWYIYHDPGNTRSRVAGGNRGFSELRAGRRPGEGDKGLLIGRHPERERRGGGAPGQVPVGAAGPDHRPVTSATWTTNGNSRLRGGLPSSVVPARREG